MNRKWRIAILITLGILGGICLIAPGARAQSSTARSICSRLAEQMRTAPATVLEDLVAKRTMRPWIVNASSQPAPVDRVYDQLPSVWRTMGGRGATYPTIESLPGTALSMVSAIAGSLDCLQYQFFELKPDGTLRMLSDPPLPADLCEHDGKSGGLATVLGQPAFIEYGSLDRSNMDSLLVVTPWKGKDWGRSCPVSIRFKYRYDVTMLYCGATKKICDSARRLAPEVKRRHDVYLARFDEAFTDGLPLPKFQFRGPFTADDQALVARAQRIGLPKRLTPGTGAPPAWLRNLSPGASEYFPLPVDGQRYLGVVDSAEYPRRSWVFVVFQTPLASSDRLDPLGAFTVQRVTSGVKSIDARDESAPLPIN